MAELTDFKDVLKLNFKYHNKEVFIPMELFCKLFYCQPHFPSCKNMIIANQIYRHTYTQAHTMLFTLINIKQISHLICIYWF